METMELLAFARGPGLTYSLVILVFGVTVRLLEMLLLGRKKDLSEPRDPDSAKYGWRTIVTRTVPSSASEQPISLAMAAGYVFHIGLFLIVFFYLPHILVFKGILGVSWPALPFWLIDAVTLITIAA